MLRSPWWVKLSLASRWPVGSLRAFAFRSRVGQRRFPSPPDLVEGVFGRLVRHVLGDFVRRDLQRPQQVGACPPLGVRAGLVPDRSDQPRDLGRGPPRTLVPIGAGFATLELAPAAFKGDLRVRDIFAAVHARKHDSTSTYARELCSLPRLALPYSGSRPGAITETTAAFCVERSDYACCARSRETSASPSVSAFRKPSPLLRSDPPWGV